MAAKKKVVQKVVKKAVRRPVRSAKKKAGVRGTVKKKLAKRATHPTRKAVAGVRKKVDVAVSAPAVKVGKMDKKRADEIVRLATKSRMRPLEIAQKLGLNEAQVYKVLRYRGVKLPKAKGGPLAMIGALFKNPKASLAEVAGKFGVSAACVSGVYRVARDKGIPIPERLQGRPAA